MKKERDVKKFFIKHRLSSLQKGNIHLINRRIRAHVYINETKNYISTRMRQNHGVPQPIPEQHPHCHCQRHCLSSVGGIFCGCQRIHHHPIIVSAPLQ